MRTNLGYQGYRSYSTGSMKANQDNYQLVELILTEIDDLQVLHMRYTSWQSSDEVVASFQRTKVN